LEAADDLPMIEGLREKIVYFVFKQLVVNVDSKGKASKLECPECNAKRK
jgi:hypothetical protein